MPCCCHTRWLIASLTSFFPHPQNFAFFPNPCCVFNFMPGRRVPAERGTRSRKKLLGFVNWCFFWWRQPWSLKKVGERHLNSKKNDYRCRLTSKHENLCVCCAIDELATKFTTVFMNFFWFVFRFLGWTNRKWLNFLLLFRQTENQYLTFLLLSSSLHCTLMGFLGSYWLLLRGQFDLYLGTASILRRT